MALRKQSWRPYMTIVCWDAVLQPQPELPGGSTHGAQMQRTQKPASRDAKKLQPGFYLANFTGLRKVTEKSKCRCIWRLEGL